MLTANQGQELHHAPALLIILGILTSSASQNVLSTLNALAILPVLLRSAKTPVLEYVEYLLHVMSPIIYHFANVTQDTLEMHLLLVNGLQHVSSIYLIVSIKLMKIIHAYFQHPPGSQRDLIHVVLLPVGKMLSVTRETEL